MPAPSRKSTVYGDGIVRTPIDPKILQKLQRASIEERIATIELLLQSLKAELTNNATPQTQAADRPVRPSFGFMIGSGNILGDVVAPALPETAWEVLQ